MEYPLWAEWDKSICEAQKSLNPSSDGIPALGKRLRATSAEAAKS